MNYQNCRIILGDYECNNLNIDMVSGYIENWRANQMEIFMKTHNLKKTRNNSPYVAKDELTQLKMLMTGT